MNSATNTHESKTTLSGQGVHYQRKYYLIRKLKAEGYQIEKADGFRTILIPANLVQRAQTNSAIQELISKHQFRIRYVAIESTPQQAELAFQTQNKKRMLHLRKRATEIMKVAINIAAILEHNVKHKNLKAWQVLSKKAKITW